MFTAEQIGRVGEIKFDEWCNEASLTSSAQNPDLLGIDRYVELPTPRPTQFQSLDIRPSAASCYVQIKTISASQTSWRISLSVAERLAKSVKPAFVVLIKLDSQNKVQSAAIAHIRGHLLERILKRLRAIEPNAPADLNKRYLSLTEKDGITIALSGKAISDALASAIGPSMDAYARDKEEEKSTLGYPEYRYRINVTLSPTKYDELVDAFLEGKPVKFERLEVFEERFSISRPASPGKISRGTLTAGPIKDSCASLRIESILSGEFVELDCDLNFPAIPGIPKEYFRFKLESKIINIMVAADTITATISGLNDESVAHDASSWEAAFSALHLLVAGKCRISFREKTSGASYQVGDSDVINPEEMAAFQELKELAKALRWLYQASRTPEEPLSFSTLQNIKDEVLAAHAIMNGSPQAGQISFCPSQEQIDLAQIPESIVAVFVSGVPVGDKVFAYAARTNCSKTSATSKWQSDRFIPVSVSLLEGTDVVQAYKQYVRQVEEITGARGVMVRELIRNPEFQEIASEISKSDES